MLYKLFVLITCISNLLLSCSTGKEVYNSSLPNNPVQKTYTDDDTVIVFVIMKMYIDSITHTNKILVKDKIYTKGYLKTNRIGFINTGSYLYCLLYSHDKLLDSIQIEHPLRKNVEYIDENHQMKMKEIYTQEGEFSVRFQLKGKENRLKIMETVEENITKELTVIQL